MVRSITRWQLLFVLGLALLACRATAATVFEQALSAADIDAAACVAYRDGEVLPVTPAEVAQALGLAAPEAPHVNSWTAGHIAHRSPESRVVFRYRVAFHRAVPVGSILYPTASVFLLRADAPYPGDPDDPSHWQPVAAADWSNSPRFATLPPDTTTRALLLVDERREGRSWGTPIRLYTRRLHSIGGAASVRADRHYRQPARAGGEVFAPGNLLHGTGAWRNTGKNENGFVHGPFISIDQPSWLALAWPEEQLIHGLFVVGNAADIRIDTYAGPPQMDPLVGLEREWQAVPRDLWQMRPMRHGGGHWIRFHEPLVSRGLRLRIVAIATPEGGDSKVVNLSTLHIFSDLGDAPPPAPETPEPPPFAIPYTMPTDGYVTLAINDTDGRRVRNLIARESRSSGPGDERWDLRNDSGTAISPGTYRWTAIAHPPLSLHYQMTAYPNVSQHHPANSPWLNGWSGAGGWLADHTPPSAVCASPGGLFFGSRVPESSVGFVATDTSGQKLWGIHSFADWAGAKRLAAGGGQVFVENGTGDADRVWAVDPGTQEFRSVLSAANSSQRRRGVVGMAASDDALYLAVNARDRWLENATGRATVDLDRSIPSYRPKRPPRRYAEVVPDPQTDFLRLLRLSGNPPGYNGLVFLESTKGPESRQHLVVAFKSPVAIGSCVLPSPRQADLRVELSVLRDDAPARFAADDEAQWQPFAQQPSAAWDVAIAPPDTRTRALRVTFIKGEGDAVAALMDEFDDSAKVAWTGQLGGLKILRRRYRNIAPDATVRVNSGTVAADGSWDAKRQEPLSPAKPGIYVLEWPKPQALRGLAINEVDGRDIAVDVYTGPDSGPISLTDNSFWRESTTFVQARRSLWRGHLSCNERARYLDSYVDLGPDLRTRAIRLRVLTQFTDHGKAKGLRIDRGGDTIDPTRCRIYGVAALQYVGGEAPVDPLRTERLEVREPADGSLRREFPLPAAGAIATAADGTLYAITAGAIAQVDTVTGERRSVVTDLQRPTALTVGPDGRLYVFDAAPERQLIRVYDAAGTYLHDIGQAGGIVAGPWTGQHFQAVTAMAIGADGTLWVVDSTSWPKHIAAFAADGTFLREYLGPTEYGGGGCLDPEDRTRLFYGPLEFALDWETGTSRLRNVTWTGPAWVPKGRGVGEMPIRANGHLYLVNRPNWARNEFPCGLVSLYQDGRARPVAAVGQADAFEPLKSPEIIATLAGQALTDLQFIWCDRNGDGGVQAAEVTFSPRQIGTLTPFNRDLGIQAGSTRFVVTRYLENGAPVYETETLPLTTGGTPYRLDDGGYYTLGRGRADLGTAADGSERWRYHTEGAGVGPDRSCGPYTPDQVVGQFSVVGHEMAGGGDLGEFLVVNANLGSWNVWTADGLLAARIFRDLRDPERARWTMPEHTRGMRLDDVALQQEHFGGWLSRDRSTGRYFAVAGHTHASIVEVIGLDRFTRLSGEITVTAEDVAAAQEWARAEARLRARTRLRVVNCFAAETLAPGGHEPGTSPTGQAVIEPGVALRVSYVGNDLHLSYRVQGHGPFRNTGNQWDRLFKTGACVDLMIGVNEAANPKRQAPTVGDKRLLFSMLQGKPVAILYDAVVPHASNKYRWTVESPVASVAFDVVRRVTAVKIAVDEELDETGSVIAYTVDAVVPADAIGLKLTPGARLRFDWGYLETDAAGSSVLARRYWSNPTTSTLADAPSEARLEPDLWGYMIVRPPADADAALEILEDTLDMPLDLED